MNTELEIEITKIADARLTPQAMAERFSRQWPQAASAAEAAARHVTAGAVIQRQRHMQATEATAGQKDLYSVDDRFCSHTGDHCECSERAAVDPKFGRLCSHRIAVMMHKRLMAANADALIAIIQAMQATGAERIILMIDRYYRGEESLKFLRYIGFGRDNGPRVDDANAPFEIDNAGLERAAAETGMAFRAPSKGRQYRYYYTLEAQDGTDNALTLRQLDAAPFVAIEHRQKQLAAETEAIRRMVNAA